MNKFRFLGLLLCVCSFMVAYAQKPQWVGNTPKELNSTYKFTEVVSTGSSLNAARVNAVHQLAENEQLVSAVQVSVNSGMLTRSSQVTGASGTNETITEDVDIDVRISGEKYRLQANRVDEYVAKSKYGEIVLHTLFMVAVNDHPVFDRTYVTTSYGAKPVFMSIIPGLGQWYKGSKVKGISMFAAEAASVAAIIVCENQRSSYIKKMQEQPKYADFYNDKASNWEMGRNISIGLAAGVWVYNIVDAIVAKGAPRIKVRRAGGRDFSIVPFATPEVSGVSLSYRF